ncbi:MAG: hypothetical protein GY950_25635 [bacterium]|nr:hypothetical protein [bacterium]
MSYRNTIQQLIDNQQVEAQLTRGSGSKDAVRALQNILYKLGFGEELGWAKWGADGSYGNGSANAVKAFAQKNKLDDNGDTVSEPLARKMLEVYDMEVEESADMTSAQLKEIMPGATNENIEKYLGPLNREMPKFGIDTPLRKAHFLAQVAHESGSFRYSSENLNYSADALRRVFGKYFPTDELAAQYARKPEKIASRVYGNRMGNGDEASGDGWKYRGRGLIQLTGHDNYTRCGKAIGLNLEEDPGQVAENPEVSVAVVCWYWESNNLNHYADQDDVKKVTKRINGGYIGLKDREENLERAKHVLC